MAEKTKLKEIDEHLDRVSSNQKVIQEQLRKIRIDEFRNKQIEIEKALKECCLKKDTSQMHVEVMQLINKNSALLTNLRLDFDKNRQRVEARLEDLSDKGRGRTESIVKLQQELVETNQRIMQSRRAAANNASFKDKFGDANPASASQSIDKEVVDELDEEIKQMRLEINQLIDQVSRLQKQSLAHGNQQDAVAMKTLEDRLQQALEQH